MVEILQLIGTIIAVLIVVSIILAFWVLLWKLFLSRFKFFREILNGEENNEAEKAKKGTPSVGRELSEKEAQKQREERIRARRIRKID